MNIFLVSQEVGSSDAAKLVSQISRIELVPANTTAVIVVDERYGLDDAQTDSVGQTTAFYLLDDFLHERSSVSGGVLAIDPNVLARKLGYAPEDWLVIDFGLHGRPVGLDFTSKLATFTFLFSSLRKKNLVLLMPQIYLSLMARHVNYLFNNLPDSQNSQEKSSQFKRLLLLTTAEKLYMSSPIIAWPIAKIRQVVRFFYSRVIHVDG